MESLKSTAVIFFLAVGLFTSAVPAKPASVLLQEGLYAEEIEGDLDAAIKIYEQVVAGVKEAQQAAAQAMYRIGMCYLKKGEQAKAVTQFSNLVSRFSEQKSIVDKARKQLAKLRPPIKVFEPPALIEQIKSGKVPSFKVQLHDNTALDLDNGEIAILKDEWPDRFDVAWDNDESGVLMKKEGSGIRFLALSSGEKQTWDNVIYMARSDIDELRNSNTRGIWASRGKFAAVLTSEGNLAVIQIGEYDANKGTIYGWVEKIPAAGFGPVIERVIYDPATYLECFIDFESGEIFKIPEPLRDPNISPAKAFEWFTSTGIDAQGDTRGSPRSHGLVGFPPYNAAAVEAPGGWNATPETLIAITQQLTAVGKSKLFAKDHLPTTYYFKTRQGNVGVLQILGFTTGDPRGVKFRYKMLQDQAKTAAGGWRKVFLPDADTRGTDVVLDFDSGELLPAGEGDRQLVGNFAELGKGDLAYDRALICLRGAKAGLIMPDHAVYNLGEHLVRLKVLEKVEDVTAYQLDIGDIPGRYLVTTGEDKDYEVNILSADARGVELIYKKATGNKLVERRFEFGPEVERIMQEDGRPDSWIDFDTSQIYHPPKDVHDGPEEPMFAWIRQCGIDAAAEDGVPGFMTVDLTAVRLAQADWNHLIPSQLIKAVARRDAHIKPVKQGQFDIVNLISIPGSTFGFKTREGGLGILQVVDFMEDPWRVKIRYKMLQGQEPIPSLGFGSATEFEFKKPTWIGFEGHSAYSGTAAGGKKSVDVKINLGRDVIYLEGKGTTFALIANQEWDDLTPYEVWHALAQSQREESLEVRQYPTNYAFQTREGRMGLIQVWGPFPARICYKMLQEQVENPAIANALSVAEAFLAAAVSGRDSDAIKLVKPGSAVVSQIKDFHQILDPEKLKIVSILADEATAVVTTAEISTAVTTTETSVEDKGPLLIRLIKQRGMWMVEDIDLETPASLKAELDSFLQKHPNATKLQKDQFRYKMLRPVAVKETVNLNVGKPAYEWWRSEPIVTHTIYEDSQLEIVWDVEPEMANKILSFGVGVLPMKGDISDIKGHLWWVRNLAFTVRRTPYGKKWGRTEESKPLKSGEYKIYICAFDINEHWVWQDMLKKNLVGAATAKLIVRPRPSTQIATPREAKLQIDLGTPEATIKSFIKAVYVGNLEAAKTCVSKDGHDYDEFMEMLATESNHPFQAMIKAMDVSVPVEITSKSIKDGKCMLSWYFTLGRVYYIGETKMKKGMHQEFSSYLEHVGDKWLIRDI
jgi:hypothetical protein